MLYDKSKSEKPDKKLFENPGKEFRGAPFWAWNAKLDKKELLWQIDRLKDMGFGGFFMHTRCGMATEYLGREYMEMVKACDEHAEKRGYAGISLRRGSLGQRARQADTSRRTRNTAINICLLPKKLRKRFISAGKKRIPIRFL